MGIVYLVLKVVISALIIVAISELSKRSSLIGGLLASLPLVSVLGMIWLYVDTRDPQKVAALSTSIFWLVIPSLVLFICLPILLRKGLAFGMALSTSIAVMLVAYGAMVYLLPKVGVKL
jgi:uncharacterized membrane protein (GlpM family)